MIELLRKASELGLELRDLTGVLTRRGAGPSVARADRHEWNCAGHDRLCGGARRRVGRPPTVYRQRDDSEQENELTCGGDHHTRPHQAGLLCHERSDHGHDSHGDDCQSDGCGQ